MSDDAASTPPELESGDSTPRPMLVPAPAPDADDPASEPVDGIDLALARKLIKKHEQEKELEPYQIELLRLQEHLEQHNRRMIVLFEGRDAAGKGGTIRRVTRYMNEKHYRVVALGKPTEQERTQWYSSATSSSSPTAGRSCCSTGPGTTGRWSSPCSGSAPTEEHRDFLRGVVGFEKDLVRAGHDPGEALLLGRPRRNSRRRASSGAATTRCDSGS